MLSFDTMIQQVRGRRIIAGIGANLISEIARAALLPLMAIVAARYLGSGRYGVFATGQALQAFAATFAGFGLMYAVLQIGARREEALRSLLGHSLVGAVISAAVAFAGLAAWVYLFGYSGQTRAVVLIMGTALFPMACGQQLMAALQVEGRYTTMAIGGVVAAVANVVCALIVVLGNLGLTALALSPVIGSVAMAAFMAYALREQLAFRIRVAQLRNMFRVGFLFGLGEFLYFIYFSIDLVLLSLLVGERAVGLYNIPVRVLVVAYLLPVVVFNRVLYPRYFEWGHLDRDRLHETYVLTTKGMLLIGLIIATGLILVAHPFVPFIFGSPFRESAFLLQILALAVPFRYVSSSAAAVLTTTNRIGTRVRIQAATAVFNVALCLIMIPFFEARGAAVATVLTEALLAALQVFAVSRAAIGAGLAQKGRIWLFALPYGALAVAMIWHAVPWAFALCELVAVVSLLAIVGPFKFFQGINLPALSPAEAEAPQLP